MAGAKRPDGAAARTERVTFTRPAAERIGKVVRIVEAGDRKQPGLFFGSRLAGDGGEFVRLGRISSDWAHGESATVERLDENGDPFSPSQTFEAFNYFTTVRVGDAANRNVACGLVGSTWILIEAERGCSEAALAKDLDAAADEASSPSQMSPGDGAQALLNDAGCAVWFGLTRFTVLTDAAIEGDSLVFTRSYLWAFADSDETGPGDLTFEGTTCDVSEPE